MMNQTARYLVKSRFSSSELFTLLIKEEAALHP